MDLSDKHVLALQQYVIHKDECILDAFICTIKMGEQIDGEYYPYSKLGYKKPMTDWVVLTDKHTCFIQRQKEQQKIVLKKYDELNLEGIDDIFLGNRIKIKNQNHHSTIHVEISSKKSAFRFLTVFNRYCNQDTAPAGKESILGGKFSYQITIVDNNNLFFKNSGKSGGMYATNSRVLFFDEKARGMTGILWRTTIFSLGNVIADHNLKKSLNNIVDLAEVTQLALLSLDYHEIQGIVYHYSNKRDTTPNSITFFWEGQNKFQGKNHLKLIFVLRQEMDYFIDIFQSIENLRPKIFNDSTDDYKHAYPDGIPTGQG